MNKALFLTAVTAAAIFLCACGSAEPEVQEPAEQTVEQDSAANATDSPSNSITNTEAEEINAWGDSITQGYGSDGLSYPEFLEQLTGIPVRNFGIGGEESGEIVARSLAYGSQEEDILVIQMGDNGGWRTLDDLIGQYREMIGAAGTDRYIIISSTDDPDDREQIWGYRYYSVSAGLEDTAYEEGLREAFGEHLLVGRKYLVENGLAVNDLGETKEDRERAEKGNISLQLRNPGIDNTHLNEYGYRALAQGVYEKGKELGYW